MRNLPPVLSVNSLSIAFAGHETAPLPAVCDLSFSVGRGQCIALVGESGSGKSVTAMSILRLLPRNAVIDKNSVINYDGDDLLIAPDARMREIRGKDISMVFQDPMSALNPVLTIGDQLCEPMRIHLGFSRRAAMNRALELLDEVGIAQAEQRMRVYPHQLSGGQQQRIMLAMAISCNPKLLIADEPTTALDVTVQHQIIELLQRLRARHDMSMLFITHDLGLVRHVADQVVVLRRGLLCESGATAQVFSSPTHPYTRALLACRPALHHTLTRLPVVEDFLGGSAPDAVGVVEKAQHPTVMDRAPVLVAQQLGKIYSVRTGMFSFDSIAAVTDVSLTLARGQTLGIVGESGSGKSTTAHMLMRLISPSSGTIYINGQNWLAQRGNSLLAMRRRMQIVFQNPYASLNPRHTVAQLLTEPLEIHGLGTHRADRWAQAEQMLTKVGLPDAMLRYPHEFSGGQRQRIAIARALMLRPDILVLDEAVSALDVSVQAQVLNLLKELQEEFALAYIFISHDLNVVRFMADHVLVMQRGRVVEAADVEVLFSKPQTEYTRALLAAADASQLNTLKNYFDKSL